MKISPEKFGELFSTFERSAFRLETLDRYTIAEEQEAFRAFLAGEPWPEAHRHAPWARTVAELTGQGKRMYRVHIVNRPLSDYLRFEMAWGYHRNQEAGEEFFILDTTGRPNPLAGVPDFWLFDEATTVTMNYSDIGEFLGAEILPEGRAAEYVELRERALADAEPFREWWERYS